MPKKSDKHYDKHVSKKNRDKQIKRERTTKNAQRDPTQILHVIAEKNYDNCKNDVV